MIGMNHWFTEIIKIAGSTFPVSSFLLKKLDEIEINNSDVDILHEVEDYLNKVHTDILKISNIIYKQFQIFDSTVLHFPDDLYNSYSSSLNFLQSHGFISLSIDKRAVKPITVILIDPTFIMLMCAHFADDNNMQELIVLIERCRIDLCLKASQLSIIFNLPLHVVSSVFEIFDSGGFGTYVKTIDDFHYTGIL